MLQAVPKRKGERKLITGKLGGWQREWLSAVQQSHTPTIEQQGTRTAQNSNVVNGTLSINDKMQQHHAL
jgi:hypothetical protein